MSHSLALSNLSLASSCYKSLSEEDQRKVKEYKAEREARSLAVEKAYVHDVYEQISGRAESQCHWELWLEDHISGLSLHTAVAPAPGPGSAC